jgi:hypothetical protein
MLRPDEWRGVLPCYLSYFSYRTLAYYLAHVYLGHVLALVTCVVMGWDAHYLVAPLSYRLKAVPPAGFGFGLPGVYAMWLLVVALLYWPMRKYAEYKRKHPELSWLSYL